MANKNVTYGTSCVTFIPSIKLHCSLEDYKMLVTSLHSGLAILLKSTEDGSIISSVKFLLAIVKRTLARSIAGKIRF